MILTFRHLLEKHGLGEQIFKTVKHITPVVEDGQNRDQQHLPLGKTDATTYATGG
ncbi:MAG: hypothetical protein ACK6AD_02780 [Cyanobacteriota bacterium]